MASLKGLYDKIASLIKSDTIVTTTYEPVASDLVAIYDSTGPTIGDNIVAPKKFVSVTDIGTGGGPNNFQNFEAAGAGGVTISLNSGTYNQGPLTISNGDLLSISATSVPNGLNWQGAYNSGDTYAINDVVYTNTGSPAIYKTWFAIGAVPAGQAPPTGTDLSNTYWALLGTQGPPGNTGETGPMGNPGAAVAGFRTISSNDQIRANAPYGTTTGSPIVNDRGVTILVSSTADVVIDLPQDLNQSPTNGFPINYQVTIINTSDKKVSINPSGTVNLYSADNARNLRTQYSGCTLVRQAANTWYMFGDLTNIS